MTKLVIEDLSGNFDEDVQKANKSKTVEILFEPENDEGPRLALFVEIDGEDHFLALRFDPKKFMEAVTNALMDPEA